MDGGFVHVRIKKTRKNIRMTEDTRNAFKEIVAVIGASEGDVFEDMVAQYYDMLKKEGAPLELRWPPERRDFFWQFFGW